ncbi:MAG: DEAD/DEAH box helicase [Bacteroidota bacterium]
MKFSDLPIAPELVKSLEHLGFKRPTDIQYKAIPSILKGEDVLAIAQTGTGKTAAFAIPVIHLLHDHKSSKRVEGIRCLIMVPTHELAMQVTDVFHQIGQHTRVKSFGIYGGVEQDPQIEQLQKGIDVLVATPGRMFDLVSQGYLDLSTVQILILDEADHMLDLGFYKDIKDLLRHLPRKRQTLYFSATINDKIKRLAYSLVKNPIRIQISPKNPVAKNIDHALTFVEMDDKRFFLERIIRENPDRKILVFVRTKVRAERVAKAMARVELNSMTIHGDKAQNARSNALHAFRDGKTKVLIATDVSARGIDIPKVDYVINYDLPEQAENYVHRVGRTGRAKHRGQALSFCSEAEKPILKKIESYLGHAIEQLDVDFKDYEETIQMTQGHGNDWKSLLREAEKEDQKRKKKRR